VTPARRISILLVEDDDVEVMNVQRALQRMGLKAPLYTAQDGVEALELLRGSRRCELTIFPRIILLDLNLPRMNGIELLRELRTDPELRHLVVVVLTTSDDDRDVADAFALNVAGYVVKPPTFDAFVDALETVNAYWSTSRLP
jgi:CheY-like chemotaxis protein